MDGQSPVQVLFYGIVETGRLSNENTDRGAIQRLIDFLGSLQRSVQEVGLANMNMYATPAAKDFDKGMMTAVQIAHLRQRLLPLRASPMHSPVCRLFDILLHSYELTHQLLAEVVTAAESGDVDRSMQVLSDAKMVLSSFVQPKRP